MTSLGLDSGKIPYTVYMTTKSYIKESPKTLQKFTNAIYKGQIWVDKHTSREIAEVIAPQFKENSIDEIEKIVDRYKQQETWIKTPIFQEESLALVEEILKSSDKLSSPIPYEKFINTDFAKDAVEFIQQ